MRKLPTRAPSPAQMARFAALARSSRPYGVTRPSDKILPMRVRIRVELFKGEEYIDLTRLSTLPEGLSKLLRSIGDDAGVLPVDNDWKASEFKDGSLEFTVYSSDRLSTQVAARCAALSDAIFSGDVDAVYSAGGSDSTMLQFAQFARKIRSGEIVRVGVF